MEKGSKSNLTLGAALPPGSNKDLFNPEMAVEPIDGDDPHIFSKEVAVTPYSFVDETQKYDEESPPPTYLPWQIISRKLPTSRDDLFKDLEFCEHGGLRCVNEEAME